MANTEIPAIVSTKWLQDQIKGNDGPRRDLRIMDTTFDRHRIIDAYKDCYLKEHIPHAVFFDLHNCVESTSEIPRNLPEPESFTEYVRSLGVWPDTHIIVYDRHDLVPAFRAWWLFRLYGHKNISILDGGFEKWKADGYGTSTEIPEVERSNFVINTNKTLLRTYEDMMNNLNKKTEQILDSRKADDPKMIDLALDGGIIPGSKLIPYTDLFNEDQTIKPAAELKAIFDTATVDMFSPMVVSCNTGMTACCVAAAMQILGREIPVYYGSWTEWRQRAPEELKERVKGAVNTSNMS